MFQQSGTRNVPCIACSVDSGKRHAAVVDLEEGLVLQVQCTCKPRRECLRKANDCIVIDDGTTQDVEGKGGDASCDCEELEWQVPKIGKHFEDLNGSL
jgi:hypothetical protein